MTNSMPVEKLIFKFPENINAIRYDKTTFYKEHFQKSFHGSKAIDIICFNNNQIWLIEVKDFRLHERRKPIPLAEEIGLKVRDSLAGLLASAYNANVDSEREFARKAIRKKRIRVVLHLEQPRHRSRLRPDYQNPVHLIDKLRRYLRGIDSKPYVVDRNNLKPEMSWKVISKV